MREVFHFYEPAEGHGPAHDPFKAIIAPRPIGWVSSRSPQGALNLAPYSYFHAVNGAPPMVAFSSSGYKDSVTNIEATGTKPRPGTRSCAPADRPTASGSPRSSASGGTGRDSRTGSARGAGGRR